MKTAKNDQRVATRERLRDIYLQHQSTAQMFECQFHQVEPISRMTTQATIATQSEAIAYMSTVLFDLLEPEAVPAESEDTLPKAVKCAIEDMLSLKAHLQTTVGPSSDTPISRQWLVEWLDRRTDQAEQILARLEKALASHSRQTGSPNRTEE